MKRGRRYFFTGLFVALAVCIYLLPRDPAGAQLKERVRLLCDAFTVPGLLLLCAGAFHWLAGLGALDGLLYALANTARRLIPGSGPVESYGAYMARKRARRRGGYGWLLLPGAVTTAISLIFLWLYCLYPG